MKTLPAVKTLGVLPVVIADGIICTAIPIGSDVNYNRSFWQICDYFQGTIVDSTKRFVLIAYIPFDNESSIKGFIEVCSQYGLVVSFYK